MHAFLLPLCLIFVLSDVFLHRTYRQQYYTIPGIAQDQGYPSQIYAAPLPHVSHVYHQQPSQQLCGANMIPARQYYRDGELSPQPPMTPSTVTSFVMAPVNYNMVHDLTKQPTNAEGIDGVVAQVVQETPPSAGQVEGSPESTTASATLREAAGESDEK